MTGRATFLINVILFLLATASCLLSQPAKVEIEAGSTKSGSFEVRKESGKVSVQAREFRVRIELSAGKIETVYVSMLYDPATKLFWWNTDAVAAAEARRSRGVPALLPAGGVMCLTDAKLVLFWNGQFSGRYILVLESSEHYPGLEEGQDHVLRVLREKPEFVWNDKQIDFTDLPEDFAFSKAANAIRIGPKLRDVKRVGNEWQIIEDGPNGGSALIVLSDQYEVVKTTILPSK